MVIYASRQQVELLVEALEIYGELGSPDSMCVRTDYDKILNRLYDILSMQGKPADILEWKKRKAGGKAK